MLLDDSWLTVPVPVLPDTTPSSPNIDPRQTRVSMARHRYVTLVYIMEIYATHTGHPSDLAL